MEICDVHLNMNNSKDEKNIKSNFVVHFQKEFAAFKSVLDMYSNDFDSTGYDCKIDMQLPNAIIHYFNELLKLWKKMPNLRKLITDDVFETIYRNIDQSLKLDNNCVKKSNFILICDICDMEINILNNDIHSSYKAHETTAKHIEVLNIFNTVKQFNIDDEGIQNAVTGNDKNFCKISEKKSSRFAQEVCINYCSLCKCSLKDKNQHDNGWYHKLQIYSNELNNSNNKSINHRNCIVCIDDKLYCVLCNSELPVNMDEICYLNTFFHKYVERHYKKYEKYKQYIILSQKDSSVGFSCSVCNKNFNRFIDIFNHAITKITYEISDKKNKSVFPEKSIILARSVNNKSCRNVSINKYEHSETSNPNKILYKSKENQKKFEDVTTTESSIKSNTILKQSDLSHKFLNDKNDEILDSINFQTLLMNEHEYKSIKLKRNKNTFAKKFDQHELSNTNKDTKFGNSPDSNNNLSHNDEENCIFMCNLCSTYDNGYKNMLEHCKSLKHTTLRDVIETSNL